VDKRTPRLGEVQETLLIPLYARAVETRKAHGLLSDPQAVEMVDSLDYDFSRFDGARSLLGVNLRTLLFDQWVREFLERHPSGTVVEIGTGLDTRFERLDNGTVHWFDLDLPDVIALRRGFFKDTDRRHMVSASVTDPQWMEQVRDSSPGPYFLVAEAVLVYLEAELVRTVFQQVGEELPGARFALETAASRVVDAQDGHDVRAEATARMRWGCDNPGALEQWEPGLSLTDSRTLAQLPGPVTHRLPLRYRLLLPVVATLRRRDIGAYRCNLFRFAGQ
jgi:O-methyltransferase involved in polyketide biosynthesis